MYGVFMLQSVAVADPQLLYMEESRTILFGREEWGLFMKVYLHSTLQEIVCNKEGGGGGR